MLSNQNLKLFMKKQNVHPNTKQSIILLNNKATINTKWLYFKKVIKLNYLNKIFHSAWRSSKTFK
jgi:hypothetical protein